MNCIKSGMLTCASISRLFELGSSPPPPPLLECRPLLKLELRLDADVLRREAKPFAARARAVEEGERARDSYSKEVKSATTLACGMHTIIVITRTTLAPIGTKEEDDHGHQPPRT